MSRRVRRQAAITPYAVREGSGVRLCTGGKITYPTEDAAEAAARALGLVDGATLTAYRCRADSDAPHYHLTTLADSRAIDLPRRRIAMARVLLASPVPGVPRAWLVIKPVTQVTRDKTREVLAEWEQAGVVRREGDAVVVLDRGVLAEVVADDAA